MTNPDIKKICTCGWFSEYQFLVMTDDFGNCKHCGDRIVVYKFTC